VPHNCEGYKESSQRPIHLEVPKALWRQQAGVVVVEGDVVWMIEDL